MGVQLKSIEHLHWSLLGGLSVLAWVTGLASPASVLLGGSIMGVNFFAMRLLFRYLLVTRAVGRSLPVLAATLLKFSTFMGLLALLVWRIRLDPLGLGLGASVLLVACVVEALRRQTVPAPLPVE
jgi:hypothetical protein